MDYARLLGQLARMGRLLILDDDWGLEAVNAEQHRPAGDHG